MKALLIFIKNPIEGKVKTRLAADIGNKKALEIYLKLQEHTRTISESVAVNRLLFYSDTIDLTDLWPNERFHKKVQNQSNDLGQKMYEAFLEAIRENFEKLFIIGSDCYELNSEVITNAFTYLDKYATVIGPANDGGYYGIGINIKSIQNKETLLADLFLNKDWSHEHVYAEAINTFKMHKLEYAVLPKLNDIDTIEDLKKHPSLLH